jgi:predicted ATP-dependent serine protease
MWKCQTCSFSNDIALTNCDLCDANRITETTTSTNTNTNTDTTNKDEEEDKLSVNSSDDETDGQLRPEVREEEVGGIVREKDT